MADSKNPTLTVVEGSGKADEIKRLEVKRAGLAAEIARLDEDIADLKGDTRQKVAEVVYLFPQGPAYKIDPDIKRVIKNADSEKFARFMEKLLPMIPEEQRGKVEEEIRKMREEGPEPPNRPAASAPRPHLPESEESKGEYTGLGIAA